MRYFLLLLLSSPCLAGKIVGGGSASGNLTGAGITPATVTSSTGIFSENSANASALFPYAPLLVFGNGNTALQAVMQNLSNGTNATSDWVLTNDLGGNTSYYLDLFINSSKYSQAGFTVEASSGAGLQTGDSPLYIWSDINGGLNGGGGHIIMGSSTPVVANQIIDISSRAVVMGSGQVHQATMTTTGLFSLPTWTIATLSAYTPTAAEVGALVQCANCTVANIICKSTGTTIAGFALSTFTVTGASPCR